MYYCLDCEKIHKEIIFKKWRFFCPECGQTSIIQVEGPEEVVLLFGIEQEKKDKKEKKNEKDYNY